MEAHLETSKTLALVKIKFKSKKIYNNSRLIKI
jgi:hypothetical protein